MTFSESDQSIRLNKYIAAHTGIARRQADDLIANGQVTINGKPAAIGNRYQPGDKIYVKDSLVEQRPAATTIMLHKPAGYVCSRKQQGDSPTIYTLLPPQLRSLKPVGRLDRDSSGLLLLTDDGDLAHKLTHPKFHKQKSYIVKLDGALQPLHRQMISDFGVNLEDGISQLSLERLKEGDDYQWRVLMHEGRNRQIRRTFAALGYQVIKLHRTGFGNYSLGDIKLGKYISVDIS